VTDLIRVGPDSQNIVKEVLFEQDRILEEYESQNLVKSIKYNPKTTSFIVPATAGNLLRVATLEKTDCEYKKLIFSAIYTAFYEYFFTDDYPPSTKRNFHSYTSPVVDYLNTYTFVEGREIDFFRAYEAYRINENNVLPSSTGLASLIRWIDLASAIDAYAMNLAHWQVKYFSSIYRIRALGNANYERKQVTLTDWFALSTWLRRDDVGVGHELYSKLASPKALVNSFIATITAELNEIQLAKDALISFFRVRKITPSDFPPMKKKEDFENPISFAKHRAEHKKYKLNLLRKIYHDTPVKDKYLKLAMVLVVKEFVQAHSSEFMLHRFFNNQQLRRMIKRKGVVTQLISTDSKEALFGSSFLAEVAEYVNHPEDRSVDKPKSVAEQLLYSWLMAYQAVQPSDILKLRLNDFKFVKRANGRVTHIDLEYFKGRSNTIHQVKTIETKNLLGSVVLKYIQDLSNESKEDGIKKLITNFNTNQTVAYRTLELCADAIADSVNANLIKEKASPVFIKSILAIIRNGEKFKTKGSISPAEYLASTDLICRSSIFKLTAIKNSSVHSRSDTFTPTQLINFHSHSDRVEHEFYLTESNEEWLNNAGLITRAVMQDLATNLYRASLTERAEFNSEFSHAAEIIANKKNDALSQMKMVTGENQGEVNHLGLVKKPVSSEGDSADTIYLLDTPETVFKLLHYLNQAKQNHHLLVLASSEFLLFTVLPTLEWIEELFDRKKFSKESVHEGQKIFRRYKSHLPPLFQNQIR
jgi:hypothetical protein